MRVDLGRWKAYEEFNELSFRARSLGCLRNIQVDLLTGALESTKNFVTKDRNLGVYNIKLIGGARFILGGFSRKREWKREEERMLR